MYNDDKTASAGAPSWDPDAFFFRIGNYRKPSLPVQSGRRECSFCFQPFPCADFGGSLSSDELLRPSPHSRANMAPGAQENTDSPPALIGCVGAGYPPSPARKGRNEGDHLIPSDPRFQLILRVTAESKGIVSTTFHNAMNDKLPIVATIQDHISAFWCTELNQANLTDPVDQGRRHGLPRYCQFHTAA